MKARLAILALLPLTFASVAVSVRGQQASAPPQTASAPMHGMDTMNRMHADDAKLQTLVQQMNTATGEARIDAMAALLNALVEDRRAHAEMMHEMMPMMNMMHGGMMHRGTDSHDGHTPEK